LKARLIKKINKNKKNFFRENVMNTKKKLLLALVSATCLTVGAIGFTACGNNSNATSTSATTETPTIEIKDGYWYINGETTNVKAEGSKGDKGDPGTGIAGNGIKSVEKTATSEDGLTDTYTITFTNDTTFDYTVTNGAKGEATNGKDAKVVDTVTISDDGKKLTITYDDESKDIVDIPQHDHDYGTEGSVIINPTTEAQGFAVKTCEADAHNELVVLPKLVEQDVKDEDDNVVVEANIIAKADATDSNSSGKYILEDTADCKTKGDKIYTIVVDEITYSFKIDSPAKAESGAHTYTTTNGKDYTQQDPTATEKGKLTKTCTVCGKTFEYELPELSDSNILVNTREDNKYVVVNNTGTCASLGKKTYEYKISEEDSEFDGVTVTVVVDNTELQAHNYTSWVIKTEGEGTSATSKMPTATTKGMAVGTCSVCGEDDTGHTKEVELPELKDEIIVEKTADTDPDFVTGKYVLIKDTATCTAVGNKYYTYTTADGIKVYATDDDGNKTGLIIAESAAKGHDPIETIEAPAYNQGGKVTVTCSRCGVTNEFILDSFSTQDSKYTKTVVKEPTCIDNGENTYSIKLTGTLVDKTYTFNDTVLKNGHDYENGTWSIVTYPTATTPGVAKVICNTNSGHVKEDVVLPALSSDNIVTVAQNNKYTVATTEPTCTVAGYKVYTITVAFTNVNQIEVTHTFEINADNTQTGADYVIAAKGHTYNPWEITPYPSESTAGSATRTCTVCESEEGHTDTVELPAIATADGKLAAGYVKKIDEDGKVTGLKYVSGNKEISIEPSTDMDQHTSITWEVTTMPAVNVHGVAVGTCDVCGKTFTIDDLPYYDETNTTSSNPYTLIARNDATYGSLYNDPKFNITAATCDKAGKALFKYEYTTTSGKKYIIVVPIEIGALNHKYEVEVKDADKPTTAAEGTATVTCTNEEGESATTTVTLPKLTRENLNKLYTGVSLDIATDKSLCLTAATGVSANYTTKVNGADYTIELTGLTVGPLGHVYNEADWTIVAPTADTEGSITRKCSICGVEDKITLPKFTVSADNGLDGGYVIEKVVVPATCTSTGIADCYVIISGRGKVVVKGIVTPKLSTDDTHTVVTDSWGDKTCSTCGVAIERLQVGFSDITLTADGANKFQFLDSNGGLYKVILPAGVTITTAKAYYETDDVTIYDGNIFVVDPDLDVMFTLSGEAGSYRIEIVKTSFPSTTLTTAADGTQVYLEKNVATTLEVAEGVSGDYVLTIEVGMMHNRSSYKATLNGADILLKADSNGIVSAVATDEQDLEEKALTLKAGDKIVITLENDACEAVVKLVTQTTAGNDTPSTESDT
jgi:hypothetical protein